MKNKLWNKEVTIFAISGFLAFIFQQFLLDIYTSFSKPPAEYDIDKRLVLLFVIITIFLMGIMGSFAGIIFSKFYKRFGLKNIYLSGIIYFIMIELIIHAFMGFDESIMVSIINIISTILAGFIFIKIFKYIFEYYKYAISVIQYNFNIKIIFLLISCILISAIIVLGYNSLLELFLPLIVFYYTVSVIINPFLILYDNKIVVFTKLATQKKNYLLNSHNQLSYNKKYIYFNYDDEPVKIKIPSFIINKTELYKFQSNLGPNQSIKRTAKTRWFL